MSRRRVACESSNDPVGGLACLAHDQRRAWVVLYNLVEKYDRPTYETTVTVKLANLPRGDWKCRVTGIAPGQCDPFLQWKALGSPEKLNKTPYAELLKASALPPAMDVLWEDGVLHLRMPGFSALFLELQR